jgi:tRNA dimethylallyltransferase
LLDVCDPVDHYSVAQFVSDATALIQQVQEGGKRPLLVGGTMLYFRALQTGLAHLPSRDEQLRDSLTLQAKLKGWPALHAELTTVDPVSASRIQPNDGQRIQRALEVYLLTGQTLSSLQTQQLKTQTWTFPKFILAPLARENLRLPLEQRLRLMWRAGFVEEVMALRERGDLSLDKPALRSVGYRQIWQALDGLHSMETAQQLSLQATMALAKRQYTWLRQEPDACWLAPDDAQIISRITQFLAS